MSDAARVLRDWLGDRRPRVGVVLGSGLGARVDRFEASSRLAFGALDGLPNPSVDGHGGEFVIGRLAGVEVLGLHTDGEER